MKVSKRSWFDKIFVWWYKQKHGVGAPSIYAPEGSNFCPYFWAIVLFGPARFVFFGPLKLLVFALLWSVWAIGWVALQIYDPAGEKGWVIVITMLAIPLVLGFLFAKDSQALVKKIIGRIGKVYPARTTASFFDLLEAFYDSLHDKVCPTIERVD